MATVQVYHPVSLCIPEDSSVLRNYHGHSSTAPEDSREIDFRTLFYDVFYDTESQSIIGIGPDLFNLQSDLFPMTMIVNDVVLNFRMRQIKGIAFLESEKLGKNVADSLDVEFRFKQFSLGVEISTKPIDFSNYRGQVCNLSLTTLQKDNPDIWIRDWLIWHHHKYGVNRVILYDNGSNALDSLLEFLKQLPCEILIIVVEWAFPYGISPYTYCQRGSLNHCRIRFAVKRGYCINLDIDEYLMFPRNDLIGYLTEKLQQRNSGVVHVGQVVIPNVVVKEMVEHRRCWHYSYRAIGSRGKEDKTRYKNFNQSKYIYTYENVGYNDTHHTDSMANENYREKLSWRLIVEYYIKKVIWECTRFLHRRRVPKPRIDTVYTQESEICFFHFRGLNTNWKKGGAVVQPEIFNPTKHEHEPRIEEMKSVLQVFPTLIFKSNCSDG